MNPGSPSGQMDRVRTFPSIGQGVAQADVGERAAHHDLVLAASGAVRVELQRTDAVGLQPLSGGRCRRDRSGRRDVVGRDRVAKDRQDARVHDVAHRRPRSKPRPSKNGGLAMYVESSVPRVPVARRDRQGAPSIVAVEDRRVGRPEQLRVDGRSDDRADLLGRRPDVGQEDRLALRRRSRAARSSGPCRRGRRGRTRRPAAGRRGSSPGRAGGSGPRSCDCPTGRPRRPGRWPRRRRRRPRRAGRSCRCRSCSRSRRARSRASRAAPSARPPRGSP